MAQESKAHGPLIGEAAFEVPELDPGVSDSTWFLPAIGLSLLCI